MALNIKNPGVEKLVEEIVGTTGETKTEAIRIALLQRRDRLAMRNDRRDRLSRAMRFLELEVWPSVPEDQIGKRLSKREKEAILGYGREGV